jgi:hypothetical protein
LIDRNKELRLWWPFETKVTNVADDSDHFSRHLDAIVQIDALANRILAGPETVGGRLVDDGDACRAGVISIGERTAAKQRDSQRTKVLAADHAIERELHVGW